MQHTRTYVQTHTHARARTHTHTQTHRPQTSPQETEHPPSRLQSHRLCLAAAQGDLACLHSVGPSVVCVCVCACARMCRLLHHKAPVPLHMFYMFYMFYMCITCVFTSLHNVPRQQSNYHFRTEGPLICMEAPSHLPTPQPQPPTATATHSHSHTTATPTHHPW